MKFAKLNPWTVFLILSLVCSSGYAQNSGIPASVDHSPINSILPLIEKYLTKGAIISFLSVFAASIVLTQDVIKRIAGFEPSIIRLIIAKISALGAQIAVGFTVGVFTAIYAGSKPFTASDIQFSLISTFCIYALCYGYIIKAPNGNYLGFGPASIAVLVEFILFTIFVVGFLVTIR